MGCYMLRINDKNLEYKHIMYDETIFSMKIVQYNSIQLYIYIYSTINNHIEISRLSCIDSIVNIHT